MFDAVFKGFIATRWIPGGLCIDMAAGAKDAA